MNQNHRLHSAVLPLLSEHFAMEPMAHTRFVQRLATISPETRLPTPEELLQRIEQRQAFRIAFFDDDEEGDEDTYAPPKPEQKPYQIASGIAVLPLIGCLQPREDWFTYYFPEEATATETFSANLKAAYADPDVTAVLIYVDSPGGLVSGTADAADAVYALRQNGRKPVVAFAPNQCCSAAYWIASQAAELYCGDTAWVGSVGTRLSLVDSSEFYAKMGLKITPISTGTFKAAGSDGVPVTGEVKDYFQALVDRVQVEFTGGVARGRKLKIDDARAIAKEARIYIGGDAQAAGLVDGLRGAPDVLKALLESGASGAGTTAADSGQRERSMSLKDRILAVIRGEDDSGGAGTTPENTQNQGAAAGNGAASADSGAQPLLAGTVLTHPLVVACQAAGFTTAEQVQSAAAALTERDSLKAKLMGHLKAQAKTAAIRATGRDMAATVDAMADVAQLEAFITDMSSQADKRFGTSATAGAERKSQAQNPEGGAEPQQAAAPAIDYDRIYRDRQAATNGKGK
jgi:signal peptide peptidase SppA